METPVVIRYFCVNVDVGSVSSQQRGGSGSRIRGLGSGINSPDPQHCIIAYNTIYGYLPPHYRKNIIRNQ
jgi:hypothetical protein